MKEKKPARPFVNPYLGGAVLGVVLFLSFFITGGGLGASAALSRVQTGVLDLLAPLHVDRVAYFAELSGGAILTNHCPNPKYRQFTLVKEAAE